MNVPAGNNIIEFQRACDAQACVEVAVLDGVAVRDSKAPDGPVLLFSRVEWREFVAGVKAGSFDFD